MYIFRLWDVYSWNTSVASAYLRVLTVRPRSQIETNFYPQDSLDQQAERSFSTRYVFMIAKNMTSPD